MFSIQVDVEEGQRLEDEVDEGGHSKVDEEVAREARIVDKLLHHEGVDSSLENHEQTGKH